MNETAKRVLYWTPRILCIAFAGFLAVFAADVFDEPMGAWQRALALAMHLIPSGLVLLALAVAWRREWIAAVVLPLLAAWHLVWSWGRFHWSAYMAIEGPLVVIGALFLASWLSRETPRPRAGQSVS